MLIAQITDMHVRAAGAPAAFGVDNNAQLGHAVEQLNRWEPRPDLVVATGDLTHRGTADEYRALVSLLEPLEAPCRVIPGNHDDVARMCTALPAELFPPREGEPTSYVVEDGAVRLVALDSTVPGRHDGELGPERLGWLAERLEEAPGAPTLIMLHHPPFKTGIWWMDGIGLLQGADGLGALLARHRQVRLVVCGHVHRAIQSTLGGVPVSVCPSTAYQVHLDTVVERPPRLVAEPPALQLHHWDGARVVTHTALVAYPAEPIELWRHMHSWEARARAQRAGKPVAKVIEY